MPESEARKEYKKKWREEHKEHIKQQSRQYYLDHREDKLAYNKAYGKAHTNEIHEKIKCDLCGSMVCKKGMKRHMNTDKCKTKSIEKQAFTVYNPLF